jgi:hypothetical protein
MGRTKAHKFPMIWGNWNREHGSWEDLGVDVTSFDKTAMELLATILADV